MNLEEEYIKQDSIEGRVKALQKCYDLEHLKIEPSQRGGLFGKTNMGIVTQTNHGYEFQIIAREDDFAQYITAHEFLHIWLRETGRVFKWKHNGVVSEYLFKLRNLFDDYLIETEMKKQFGNKYEEQVGSSIDDDLYFLAKGETSSGPVSVALFATKSMAISGLYPSMKKRNAIALVHKMAPDDDIEEFVAMISQYDSSIDPERYKQGIARLHKETTESEMKFSGCYVDVDVDAIKRFGEAADGFYFDLRERGICLK